MGDVVVGKVEPIRRKPDTVTMSLRLTRDLARRIEALARSEGNGVSSVVRRLLVRGLRQELSNE